MSKSKSNVEAIEPLPACFFCGCALSDHRKNQKGHPWRRGSSVTKEDLQRADAVTIQRYYRPTLQHSEGSK